MSVRLYTRIAAAIAVVAVAAAGAPYAAADSSKGVQIPANLANFREPGSTGYVPKTAQIVIPAALVNLREPGSTGYVPETAQVAIPAWLENLQEPGSTGYVPQTTHVAIPASLQNLREPGSTGWVPAAKVTVTSTGGDGLDWVSAVIGAGAALGLAIAGVGAFVTMRRRRTLAHA